MKKIISLFLSVLFLNMVFYPAVFADDLQSWQGEQFDTYLAPALQSKSQKVTSEATSASSENTVDTSTRTATDTSTQTATDTSTQSAAETVSQNQETPVAEQPDIEKTEHLAIRKNKSKKISVESVYVASHRAEIPAQDILQIAFVNDFNGKKARVGDTIEFRFPNDIVTQEGTMIIPSTTRIIAEITKLKKPKPLHLSGKVYLDFKYLQFIDGTRKPIEAKLCSKKDYLSRKTLNNTAAVGETVVTYGAGTTAGAFIGATSGTTVASIILGGSFGAGIGALAGVAVGILLPGASFKAKAGQRVNIELTQELDL